MDLGGVMMMYRGILFRDEVKREVGLFMNCGLVG